MEETAKIFIGGSVSNSNVCVAKDIVDEHTKNGLSKALAEEAVILDEKLKAVGGKFVDGMVHYNQITGYRDNAWQGYTSGQLLSWVENLTLRATHRDTSSQEQKEKAAKDLNDARNYLDMLNTKLLNEILLVEQQNSQLP